MTAEAVARTLDLQHDGMVQEAIEKRSGNDGIAEHIAPLGEASVGGTGLQF